MSFRKKRPKRLYYPVKSRWYSKPRRRPSVKRPSKIFKGGVKSVFKYLLKKSWYWALSAIVFTVLILFLTFSSYFSITDIEVVRENFNIDSAAIENELNEFIGKNILFFPKNHLLKTIQAKFPEFSLVEAHKLIPSKITIHLTSHPIVANLRAYYILPEAEKVLDEDFTELSKAIEELSGLDPALGNLEEHPLSDEAVTEAVFDIEENEPEAIEQKSLLNKIGQAIFDQEENLELMTISVRGLTQPIEDRQQVISQEAMNYMLESIQYFSNAIGLEVFGIEYLPVAREIHLKTTNNLVIWISTDRDYKSQIGKLSTIFKVSGFSEEEISYIDLRIRKKVIYCPRNSRCDQ